MAGFQKAFTIFNNIRFYAIGKWFCTDKNLEAISLLGML